MKGSKPDIILREGDMIGKLTILGPAPSRTDCGLPRRCFWCRCTCGVIFQALLAQLRNGQTRSCGCLRKANILVGRQVRYDRDGRKRYIRSRENGAWAAMKQRCRNPKGGGFQSYGGRGIKVCERWDTFENFLEDMGPCPPGRSLDRIDNNGNYEPGNCRWATITEQARNKRSNVRIKFQGNNFPAQQWAEITGIKAQTILSRLRRGWTVEDSLTIAPDSPSPSTEPKSNGVIRPAGNQKTI